MITALSSIALAGSHGQGSHDMHKFAKTMLSAHTMYGVDGPFVGGANPVRGVNGDDQPWESPSQAVARLGTDGSLLIVVRGLVVGNDPEVPPDQRLINPSPTFRGLVSCLTEGADGTSTPTVNVMTKPFKADAKGNSIILDKVMLPNPCVAPIVMVLDGVEDVWFAMTGNEN